jgi:hypothetical protein
MKFVCLVMCESMFRRFAVVCVYIRCHNYKILYVLIIFITTTGVFLRFDIF